MSHPYFLTSSRLGFSVWAEDDLPLASALWGDPAVTRYICASGRFSPEDVSARLSREILSYRADGVQYWPVFLLTDGEFVGCCGLHMRDSDAGICELGFHLRPEYWHMGLASEAASAVICHAFTAIGASALFAGHNPNNTASKKVLARLGFRFTGDEFYPPTGLMHPSYGMTREEYNSDNR